MHHVAPRRERQEAGPSTGPMICFRDPIPKSLCFGLTIPQASTRIAHTSSPD